MSLRLLLCWCALATVASQSARAEVADLVILGDQANLMAGAVTASTQGGPSIWYNPSRLPSGDEAQTTLAVSGVGFVYRYYSAPNLITTPEGAFPAKSGELLALPRATTLVIRAHDKLYWGLGLFTPARQDVALQAGPSGRTSAGTFNSISARTRRDSLHAMGSLSWSFNERFQLGASLAFVTYSYSRALQTSSAQYTSDAAATSAALTHAWLHDNIGYGLRPTVGVSLRMKGHWYLGASVAAPTWLFYTRIRESESMSSGMAASGELQFQGSVNDTRGGSLDTPEPGALRIGLAYKAENAVLELDGEASGGASARAFNVAAPIAGNLRAGMLIGTKNKLRVGWGIYTDLEHPDKALTELGDSRVRGVGGTCGVNFVSRVPGAPAPSDERKGTYSVTLAARYARYWGEVLSIDVTDSGASDGLALVPSELSVHEIALQLGLNGAW